MLKALKTLFNKQGSEKKEPTDQELKLAAATLMFEMIRSDGHVHQVELDSMGDILRREFKVNDDELEALFKLAKERADESISLHGFTREICDAWGKSKREKLLEYLWILALADEQLDAHERHLVRKVAGLLYLNEKQIQTARQAAKTQLAISKTTLGKG